ncbi:MAG TPA: sugar phosphate nucleotidyltransferase [Bacteroidales bacterium]
MKAMILAAGLGTRLGKQTAEKPKALVKVNGAAMLENLIESLKKQEIKNILINIHHHGQQVIDFVQEKENFGIDISFSDERNELLDTGGAIKKAAGFFEGNEPVLVHNVDVYSEINLNKLLEYHKKMKSFATLCVRKRSSGRALIFNDEKQLAGWTNLDECKFKWVNESMNYFETFAYNGLFLADPQFAANMPFEGKFSIIDCWLKMAKTLKITAYIDESPAWFDFGTAEKINKAEQYLKNNKIKK